MAEDYSAFLTRTGANDKEPDYSAFLARTGAVDDVKAADQPGMADPGQNEYGITGDPQQFNKQKPGLTGPKSLDDVRASVEAMPSGYFGMIPAVRSLALGALDVGQGRVMVGGGGVDEPAPNAFSLRPTPDTVNLLSMAAGKSPGTGTGRAIADTVDYGAPAERLFGSRNPENRLVMAAPDRELPTLAAPGNRLAMSLPPQEMPLPAMAGGEPVPQSVGAAASREGTSTPIPPKTEAQRITDLEKAVNQTAEERAGPQLHDSTPYLPDIPPRLLASREFSPANALDEKVARAKDTEFRAEVEANERERNMGMVDKLREDAQDGIALEKAHEARSEVDPVSLGVFTDEKPVDASGLETAIQGLLKGPAGKRGAVTNTLNSVLKSLRDSDGNLEQAPSMIYGARQNITDMLKKGIKGTGDAADDVRASRKLLTDLLPEFDKTISEGAPKFSAEYMPQFHELSQPINQMEFLQRYQTGAKKITDGDGYLIPSKVQKMLDDILQGQKASGVNPAKSLTDAQIQNIINVRNELAAAKLRDRMAAVRGADTFQQLSRPLVTTSGPISTAMKGAGMMGAHVAIGASPLAGMGNAALGAYQGVVKPAMAAAKAQKVEAAIAARKNELLQTKNRLAPD